MRVGIGAFEAEHMNFPGQDRDTSAVNSDHQDSYEECHMSWSKVIFPDRNTPSSSAKHLAGLGDVFNCKSLEWLQY